MFGAQYKSCVFDKSSSAFIKIASHSKNHAYDSMFFSVESCEISNWLTKHKVFNTKSSTSKSIKRILLSRFRPIRHFHRKSMPLIPIVTDLLFYPLERSPHYNSNNSEWKNNSNFCVRSILAY